MMALSRSEIRWLVMAVALVMLALNIPIFYGYLTQTADLQFAGFYIGLSDIHSYIGKGRYGATVPGWQFELFYTSEPHDGAILFPFYLGLGKIIDLLAAGDGTYAGRVGVLVHYAFTLISGVTLLTAVYFFVARFIEAVPQRRLAWVLVACSGGLDWLLIAAGLIPMAFYIPESYLMLPLAGLPHIALAEALFLFGWLSLFAAIEKGRWVLAVGASVLWFITGLLVPFYSALLGLLIAAWLAAHSLRRRSLAVREFTFALVAGSLPILIIVHNVVILQTNPTFARYLSQTPLPPPPIYQTVLSFLPYFVLAVFALPVLWRAHQKPHTLLLITWPLLVFPLIYVEPVQIQRRLIVSVIVPLAILTVQGAHYLIERQPQTRLPVIGFLGLTGVAFPLFVLGAAGNITTQTPPAFIDAGLIDTVTWLQARTDPYSTVILATELNSNAIPAYAQHRVYLGHGPETLFSERKREEVPAFFTGELSAGQQRAIIDEGGITHVLIGPLERELCEAAPCVDPEQIRLRLAYEVGDYRLYEVAP